MLILNWAKIDKFYIVLGLVLVLMAALLIMAFRAVFSSYITAYDIDQASIQSELKINKEEVDQAYKWVFSKEVVLLK